MGTVTRSYTIVGVGALGGYYGARLSHGGADVRFLLHSDYEHVRTHGLRVESPEGDFSLARPQIYAGARDLPQSDVVAVCLKTTSNNLLPAILPGIVKPGGAVLMMQNGLGIEADAAAVLPDHPILGGLAFLCSNKMGPGHVRHLDYGLVRFGQHGVGGSAAGVTPLLRDVAADFERAGIDAILEEDLVRARWMKLVWNVPYNGLCVVHQCTTDVLMRDPATRRHCERIMHEVVTAAEACGFPVERAFVDTMMAATDKMAAYKPSMKLDHERGLPLEVDAIYGRPLRAAEAVGVSCPLTAELHREVCRLDATTSR